MQHVDLAQPQPGVQQNYMRFAPVPQHNVMPSSPPVLMNVMDNDNISLRDIYSLLLTNREEFRQSIYGLQQEVSSLNDKISNIDPRVTDCENRIARLEDNYDGKFAEHDEVLNSLLAKEDEFPIDKSLVCTGLTENATENIMTKTQDLITNGLEMDDVRVINARRLTSRNGKPGLVKIVLPTIDDKIRALRNKRRLSTNGYGRVYIRSSQSHTDRLVQQNIETLLKELPNGNQYRITANGKLIKRDNWDGNIAPDRGVAGAGFGRGIGRGRGRGRGIGRGRARDTNP